MTNTMLPTPFTVDAFYRCLNLPERAKLGAPIYKKQLLENAALNTVDRKLINEQIDSAKWTYTIKPANSAIARYDDTEREYGEIAVIHLKLKSCLPTTQLKRLSEILHRAIPYPLFLVYEASAARQAKNELLEQECGHEQVATYLALCLADKRINRADASKLSLVQLFETTWCQLDDLQSIEVAFFSDLDLAKCSQLNLYALYSDWTRCIVALDIARRTNLYRRSSSAEADQQRLQILQAMRQSETQLASEMAKLKAESQFNRQLTLNVQIKHIQQELSEYRVQLAEVK